MEKIAGIPVSKLDRIKIKLAWDTCVNNLHACQASLDYWHKKYHCKDLLITEKLLSEFHRQPDHDGGDERDKIDVRWWLRDLMDDQAPYDKYIPVEHDLPVKDQVRILKMLLLHRFDYRSFRKLGGNWAKML